ncbi:MAG TPA: hypothetical protein VF746_23215 [Longimicrobium sp.]|jgi:hypothetical protein
MSTRLAAALLVALAALPARGAAQTGASAAGPLAAPALPRQAPALAWAPALLSDGQGTVEGAGVVLLAETWGEDPALQGALPKSHLFYSVPLAVLGSVGGSLVGYGGGLVLLGCQDESSSCETGPDNSEWGLSGLLMAVGSAAGAHFGGLRRASKGDFLYTLLAASAGALPMVIGNPSDNEPLFLGSVALSTTAAALTDHFVRKPR